MNENEINNLPPESKAMFSEEGNGQMSDIPMESTPPSSDDEDKEPEEGFTFNWKNLLIGIGICFIWSNGKNNLAENWGFYLSLAIVVIIHELGHVIFGKLFGCHIKEMQVFFLPFISYKPKQELGGSSWRDIKWSLGVLPLGGVTMFKSREANDKEEVYDIETGSMAMEPASAISPYIEDKPAWQRMLISAAGVLLNIATFLIIYVALPFISDGTYDSLWPLMSLSLFLAVLNILPIYPLDGGAILFALYEMITGNKPSSRFTTICGWIGFIFIVLFFWVFPDWLGGIINKVFNIFF